MKIRGARIIKGIGRAQGIKGIDLGVEVTKRMIIGREVSEITVIETIVESINLRTSTMMVMIGATGKETLNVITTEIGTRKDKVSQDKETAINKGSVTIREVLHPQEATKTKETIAE